MESASIGLSTWKTDHWEQRTRYSGLLGARGGQLRLARDHRLQGGEHVARPLVERRHHRLEKVYGRLEEAIGQIPPTGLLLRNR